MPPSHIALAWWIRTGGTLNAMNFSWQSTTEIALGGPETSPYTAAGDRPMKKLRSTSDCVVPSRPWFQVHRVGCCSKDMLICLLELVEAVNSPGGAKIPENPIEWRKPNIHVNTCNFLSPCTVERWQTFDSRLSPLSQYSECGSPRNF